MQEQLKKMRIEILGDVTDTSKDDLFKSLLEDAENIALNKLYPFDNTKTSIDDTDLRLLNWQVRCAIELYGKLGKAGVQSYSENGLSITYLSEVVSTTLMNELVPKAGVPK